MMEIRYTISRRWLSDDELYQIYRDSLRMECDASFIRILEDTIADRGLNIPGDRERENQVKLD